MKKLKNTLVIIAIVVLTMIVMPANVFAATPPDITSVNIKNFTEPSVGGMFSDSTPTIDDIEYVQPGGSGTNVITSVTANWIDPITSSLLSPSHIFEKKMYMLNVEIKVDSSLARFQYDSHDEYIGDFTINGQNPKALEYYNESEDPDRLDYYFIYDFREEFDVENLKLEFYPTAGTKVKDHEIKANIGIFANWGIFKETATDWDLMNEEEVFEAGKRYKLMANIISNDYKLIAPNKKATDTPDIYEVMVSFNGKKTKMYFTILEGNMLYIDSIIFESKKSFNVTFDANGHGTAPEPQTVIPGNKVEKPDDLSERGYTFGGWYTDKECTNEYNFDTNVYEDLTLFAKWTKEDKGNKDNTPKTGTIEFVNYALAIMTVAGVSIIALNKKSEK